MATKQLREFSAKELYEASWFKKKKYEVVQIGLKSLVSFF